MSTDAFRAARDLLLAHRTDYATAYERFRWPELDEFNWAVDWFDVVAAGNDRPALWIIDEDGQQTRRSFAELSERSSRLAGWLSGLGVRRGDRLVLMLGNQVELWETLLAAMKLGAVVIPATTLLTPADLRDRIDRGGARHVVADAAQAEKFAEVPGDYTRIAVGPAPAGWSAHQEFETAAPWRPSGATRASDPLLLYFTSGTTAAPKLVEHTHASYPVGHLSTMYWIGIQPGDIHLNISSPGWAKHAWSSVFAPWNAEACVLVVNQARFAAERLLAVMREAGVTTFCAPPTVWRMLIQADLAAAPVPSLRECVSAGEPLNPEVIEQVEKAWGITIRDGYGQTETTAQVGNPPGSPVKPGSMGRPLPGYRVALLDPISGRPGEEGEICLELASRPLGLMTGYAGDAARNDEAMAGGYYHTGDVGSRDADGYITYIGRADDVFKASDYRISPFELESVLIEHPAVAEAAVVPSPDPVRLAVPKAYVTLTVGTEASREVAESILRFARQQLAPYKRVRRIEFAELPKTISGKIRRVELRRREEQVHGDGSDRQRRASEWEFWEDDFPTLSATTPPR